MFFHAPVYRHLVGRILTLYRGDGIKDEIEAARLFFHFSAMACDDNLVGPEAERIIFFIG